jgi:lysophospholipase L1-like esterase
MKKRLLLVLTGLVLGYVTLDIALRAADALLPEGQKPCMNQPPRWQPNLAAHPFLPYAGPPGTVYRIQEDRIDSGVIEVRTNAFGFRSLEFDFEPSADDFVVVCLGGSTTWGEFSATNEETWPAMLGRRLAERYPDVRFKVYNLGTRAASSAYSTSVLAALGQHLRPDLVIVYHGENDVRAMRMPGFRPDHAHLFRDFDPASAFRGFRHWLPPRWHMYSAPLSAAACQLDRILGVETLVFQTQYPNQRLPWPGPGEGTWNIDATIENYATIAALARAQGAATIFSTFKFFAAAMREDDEPEVFNDAARAFFARRRLAYVDQARLIPDGSGEYNHDGCHFTRAGDELMAQNFLDFIVKQGLVPEAR